MRVKSISYFLLLRRLITIVTADSSNFDAKTALQKYCYLGIQSFHQACKIFLPGFEFEFIMQKIDEYFQEKNKQQSLL